MAVNNLEQMLKTLAPSLDHNSYVFCSFPDRNALPDIDKFMPLATFQEEEGITWIITQDQADRLKLVYERQTKARRTELFVVRELGLLSLQLPKSAGPVLSVHPRQPNRIHVFHRHLPDDLHQCVVRAFVIA
ncbi:ACT domain-containing protein [Pseudohongiella nitratireducens]|uniref:ACT domain-containing protein n=1 Tax=Pseudohongiella nitratireducens TaxID=1768907 RepID=UPI003C6E34E7